MVLDRTHKPPVAHTPRGPKFVATPRPADGVSGGSAKFTLDVPNAGRYYLAAEVYWLDGEGNSFYIKVDDAAEKMGVDVMRWLYCAHKPENDLLFGFNRGDETRRRFLIPLWNVYSFLATYANLDNWMPKDDGSFDPKQPAGETPQSDNLLDRWILSRINQIIPMVNDALENSDPLGATTAIEAFLDDLTNWYVRRSRRRFWKSEQDADKDAAYATLYHVLVTLSKLLAPMVPFVTEVIYQNLVRTVDGSAPESVHHCEWPKAEERGLDTQLLERMALAIQIAALGRSARSRSGLKLRQPLARARVYAGPKSLDLGELVALVTDELNVKSLEFVDREADLVRYEIGLLPGVLGPKHGRRFPLLRQAVAAADAAVLARRFQSGLSVTLELEDGGPAVELLPEEVEVRTHGREGYAVAEDKGIVVAVDVALTPELVREGLARDLVRSVQTLRKEADFQLDDRIVLYYDANEDLEAVVQEWADYIQGETLSRELVPGPVPDTVARQATFKLGGQPLTIGVQKA